jgi:hypothetical protein
MSVEWPIVGEEFDLDLKRRVDLIRAEVSMDTSKVGFQRLGEAIFRYRMKVLSTHVLGRQYGFGRAITGTVLIEFPVHHLQAIQILLGKSLIEFRPPPIVSTN